MQEISTITAQIQKAVSAFYEAYSKQDAKKLKALFAPAWTGFGPGPQQPDRSEKELQTYLEDHLLAINGPFQMKVLWVKVHAPDNRLAWAEGVAQRKSGASAVPVCSHRFSMAYVKVADRWLLMHGHWSVAQPEGPCQEKHALQKLQEQLKMAQSQLMQHDKLAALGQLAAGVAHEINNPVNFISGGIDSLKANFQEISGLLQQYLALDPAADNSAQLAQLAKVVKEMEIPELMEETEQVIRSIQNGTARTTEIVRSMRNFSRLDGKSLKKANVQECLDSTLVILGNKLKDRIEVFKAYDYLPEINCYPGQLSQVFMNLLSNAIQAIEGSGKIWIQTSLHNGEAEIRIKDSGAGMPQEVIAQIFEPFFTTKEVGEGTGLGLSISRSIIQKHKGAIQVSSQPGEGTEFIIRLPLDLT
jgi:two-component system, NtrC family, sensor kinase